jgi:hypothetical protein
LITIADHLALSFSGTPGSMTDPFLIVGFCKPSGGVFESQARSCDARAMNNQPLQFSPW